MTEQQKELEIVYITDVTLRDGEQTPGIALMPGEKLEIARQLDVLGVDGIEAGFPATHRIASKAVTMIARSVKRPTIGALARAVSGDIYEAWESLRRGRVERPNIHVFISSSDIHQMHQLRKDGNKVMEMAVEAVKLARSYCPYVEFSPMDATRTNPIYLYVLLEAVIRAGATTVNIPDTIGCTTPLRFSNLIRGIFDNVPNIDEVQMSVHCHDDEGFATANSLAAVHAGVRQIEVTINGAGERAGNADLAQVVMGLENHKDEYGCRTNIDTTKIGPTSRLFSRLAHLAVQRNTPYVGGNAFSHESGIHQDGVLKEISNTSLDCKKSYGRTRIWKKKAGEDSQKRNCNWKIKIHKNMKGGVNYG